MLGVLAKTGGNGEIAGFLALDLQNFILINIFLALFNLLPIPPLDGSHIVEGVLPRKAARTYARGLPLPFVLLLVVPYFWPDLSLVQRVIQPPFVWVADHYYALAKGVAGI